MKGREQVSFSSVRKEGEWEKKWSEIYYVPNSHNKYILFNLSDHLYEANIISSV